MTHENVQCRGIYTPSRETGLKLRNKRSYFNHDPFRNLTKWFCCLNLKLFCFNSPLGRCSLARLKLEWLEW